MNLRFVFGLILLLIFGTASAENQMSVGSTIDDFYNTLKTMGITTAIKPLAFSIIGVTVAARCVVAIQTGLGDLIGAAIYGGIAAALVTFSTTTDNTNLKDASLGAWKAAYNVAQTQGMKSMEGKISNIGNVFGVVVAKMADNVESGLRKTVTKTITTTATGGTSSSKVTTKQLDAVEKKITASKAVTGKMGGMLKFLVGLVAPIIQSYILTNAVLGVCALSLGLISPLMLAGIAFGTFKPLTAYISVLAGIVITTMVAPAIFTAAIQLGFIMPLENAVDGIKQMGDKMANFDWFDPIGSLESIMASIIMVVVTMLVSVLAAFQFVQQAPGAILRTLQGGAK